MKLIFDGIIGLTEGTFAYYHSNDSRIYMMPAETHLILGCPLNWEANEKYLIGESSNNKEALLKNQSIAFKKYWKEENIVK